MRLMALRWRSNSAPPAQAGPGLVVPATGRLRGIASFNGMAVVKLVMKPSALKTLEAQPCNGVAVYLNGSMLNHSCFPTVNRRGPMSSNFHNQLWVLGWRPLPLGWRPSLVGWRPSLQLQVHLLSRTRTPRKLSLIHI